MLEGLGALLRLAGRRCHACGGAALRADRAPLPPLCGECAPYFAPWTGAACPGCGAVFRGETGGAGHLCSACRLAPRPWDRLVFHALYEGALRDVVQDYKFRNRMGVGRLMQGMAVAAWRSAVQGHTPPAMPDVLVPVPLHVKRLRSRGFNQSLELARGLARELDRPTAPQALERLRDTRPQTGLSAAERRDNVRGAFRADESVVRGAGVLLLDDVMTTGGTLNACAAELFRAGAASVTALVVARTPER